MEVDIRGLIGMIVIDLLMVAGSSELHLIITCD